MTTLTVIICTYNRARMLEFCLRSLTKQSVGNHEFSVIVVNNNSTDGTSGMAHSFSSELDVLLCDEVQQGLSHARNKGLALAQTPWVAFLDDDAEARPDWVESILRTIATEQYDCFGGVFFPWHHFCERPHWFDPTWESSAYFGSEDPCGGNCVINLEVARACGGFPVHLGMKGGNCAYGEETLLFRTMRERGYRIGFVEGIVVDHCVLPYKYSLRWRLLSSYAMARDGVEARNYQGPGFSKAVYRLGGAAWRMLTGLTVWLDCARGAKPWQRAVLDWLSPCAARVGEAVGYFRHFLRNKNTQP